MDSEEIEERAEKTLREKGTYRVPVQIDKIARVLWCAASFAKIEWLYRVLFRFLAVTPD